MMTVTPEAIASAEKAISTTGFVTAKTLPDLKDRDFSRELAAAVTKAREKKQEEGYIYSEEFDFAGGEIENIIWNMDQIKSRDDAKQALADDMGLTMPVERLSEADKKEF